MEMVKPNVNVVDPNQEVSLDAMEAAEKEL